MRSMNTFEGPLVAFRRVLVEDLAAVEVQREHRRARYEALVEETVIKYREVTGYKIGPMMNEYLVRSHFGSLMNIVVERQLMMLVAPMLATAQAIERSLHHVTIFASPSRNGAERYAPKPRGTMPHQIRVGAERVAHKGYYAD